MDDSAERKSILRMENVSRLYGHVPAVRSIDLELFQGEILTLLGPSGCGKTTTLRMAIGLERATSGSIEYLHRTVDDPSQKIYVAPEHRDMGMVFQSYAIWPHMTVFENVAFPLRARKIDNASITQRVNEVVELVGLNGFQTRSAMQLSGGQQQRVAVARGLVARPNLLLMDEPFSNLDAQLREQMRVELKRLQRRLGFSILFVTHDQSEALALSDRIAVMKDGNIEQIGSPMELYADPSSVAVRDFLGRSIKLPVLAIRHETSMDIMVRFSSDGTFLVRGKNHCGGIIPGTKCVISIRPEHVIVERPGAHGINDNQLIGRIVTLLFMGDCFEADIELPNSVTTVLKLAPTRGWKEGEDICLTFPPENLHLWEDVTADEHAA